MKLIHTLLGMALVGFASCQQPGEKDKTAGEPERNLLDPANMDTTVRPGDNFFLYANGAWLKNNPIPPTETRWGSFSELQEHNYKVLHELLEEAAAMKAAAGTREQKVGDFYRSGMDSTAIEKAGLTPLNTIMARIDDIQDADGVMGEIATQITTGLSQVFYFYISPDDKKVTEQMCQFWQGGLGLPDRDYYFDKDPQSVKIREAYNQYLVKIFTFMGVSSEEAATAARNVFELETKLAGASMKRVDMRDPYKVYNKFDLAGLGARTGLDWKKLLANLRVNGVDSCIVGQPAFFTEVGKQLKSTPVDIWKQYLRFHLVNKMTSYLNSEIDKASFEFYGRTLRGQQEQKPRWKRILNEVDGSVGELLGQMYVDKHFRPEAKQRMLDLVDNLQQTYADRINRLDWMSEATKQKALAKLGTFMKKIGYPDKWKDYSKLTITDNNYVQNILNAAAFEYDYNLAKLGRPVDRTEWAMTPPTVNAYYNPAFNEIVFPAGILQYPFFDFDADDALNYGGIGAVIGHEMTHGFDDQGRQYDAHGNLHDWWTPEDARKFTEKANIVVEQFNGFVVLDSIHVNGHLTLGENLADLGGLAIAYEAFKKTQQGQGGERIDGFTPEQRFFLSWAQVWRASTRPEELAQRIKTDPHSPNELRCNGPLSNMPEFYEAFGIQPGDKMYRPAEIRAHVW